MLVKITSLEIEPKLIFLKLFGRPRDIPAKSRDIPPKKFDFPGFEGRMISNFLAPTRSRGRPLPHWKISGPKSLGLGSFFLPDDLPLPSPGQFSQV